MNISIMSSFIIILEKTKNHQHLIKEEFTYIDILVSKFGKTCPDQGIS